MLDADLRQETDEVVRTHGELLRRLGQEGISDVAELAERFGQVRRAAGALSAEEIDAALLRVSTLLQCLKGQRIQLDELSHVLSVLGSTGPAGPVNGDPQEALD